MAKAIATCKCATCGKEFTYETYKRNCREAASFEKWAAEHFTECYECEAAREKAQHDEENAKAATIASEMGYPELLGSEKQIAWATSIREQKISILQEYYLDPEMLERHPESAQIYELITALILKHTAASWWIDCRNDASATSIVRRLQMTDFQAMEEIKKALSGDTQKGEQLAPVPAPKPERPTAIPEEQTHTGAAEIHIERDHVQALYDRNESFRKIVKSLGFSWIGSIWQLTGSEIRGTAENIAAELGNRLLNAGFAVRFDSEALMQKAVRGEYEPMKQRWIICRDDGFAVYWGSDDHYHQAKALPGARYHAPGIIVPDRSYLALLDFADRYGYSITQKAAQKLQALSGASSVVTPTEPKSPDYQEQDALSSSREVIDDLKD